jgi:hypothetical protein
MTNFDKEKVHQWIQEYWTRKKDCQICGSDDWILMDNVWELRKFERGGLVVGSSPLLPVVALMCNVCGQMVFFNAFAVRALKRGQQKGNEDEQ